MHDWAAGERLDFMQQKNAASAPFSPPSPLACAHVPLPLPLFAPTIVPPTLHGHLPPSASLHRAFDLLI
jgi:hypothetical protein